MSSPDNLIRLKTIAEMHEQRIVKTVKLFQETVKSPELKTEPAVSAGIMIAQLLQLVDDVSETLTAYKNYIQELELVKPRN